MTHLKIEQNNGIIEEVSSEVIEKLYNIIYNDNLDNTSNLIGRLHTPATYQYYIDYLENMFKVNGVKLLVIDATKKYMFFADSAVLSRMLQYLGDGIGITSSEITNGNWYSNTTDPNTNSTLFTNNTSITSFNELGLLSQITNIPNNTFKGCTNLTNIDLRNITSIGNQSFLNCSSLTTIGDLSNCTSISSAVFYGCTSLTSVDLSNIVSIGSNGFYNCTNLLSIISIQNVTSIGSDAFKLCDKILEFETLNLPNLEVLSTGGEGTFDRCTQIKHIVNLGTITKVGAVWNGTFAFCTELLDVILPETIVYIEYNGFLGCTKLKYIKVLSTQVPTYSLKDGHGNTRSYGRFFGESYSNNNSNTGVYNGLTFPIYVKDELLSQYQSSDGWMYVGPNRLKPLSQFATDFPNG